MDFLKVIYENVAKKNQKKNKKKNKKTSQQVYLYLPVTGIRKLYQVVFCTYCKEFCLKKIVIMLLYSTPNIRK